MKQTANNGRFLILPWVKVPNLASHVLSLNIKRLTQDWTRRFNQTLLFLDKKDVRSLQRFMKTYQWDQEAMESKHLSL